jgi:hypothetical protein
MPPARAITTSFVAMLAHETPLVVIVLPPLDWLIVFITIAVIVGLVVASGRRR